MLVVFPPPLQHPVEPDDELQHHRDDGEDYEDDDVDPFPLVFAQETDAFKNVDDG